MQSLQDVVKRHQGNLLGERHAAQHDNENNVAPLCPEARQAIGKEGGQHQYAHKSNGAYQDRVAEIPVKSHGPGLGIIAELPYLRQGQGIHEHLLVGLKGV